MANIKIKIRATGCSLPEITEKECTAIECWYDRHIRLWTLYPVDAEGNQLDSATYAYGKVDAMVTKEAMEAGLIGKKF